jgi:phosphate-selective porin OprO and OprP
MNKTSKTWKKIGLFLASLGIASISGSALADFQVQTEGGLMVFDPVDDSFWFRVGGRAEFDQIFFSGTYRDRRNNFPNTGNIRRGFLAFGGGVGDCWIYNLTFDFGRTIQERFRELPDRRRIQNGFTYFEDAWIGYTGLWECSRIRFGQFTPLTTLDGWGNYGIGNGQMFLESALATRAFDRPSYYFSSSTQMKGFGIILDTQLADLFTVAATVYEPAQGHINYNNNTKSDRVGAAMRLTFSPIHEEGCAYHFGVLGRYQSVNATNGRFAPLAGVYNNLFFTTPEVVPRNYVGVFDVANPAALGLPVHGTNGSPVVTDAGPFRAKSYNHFAGEAAGIWGPITLAGEYHHATVQRKPREPQNLGGVSPDVGNVDFHGWHVQGGYVLTGESREYDFAHGAFGGISPCTDWGAWELVARFSYLTLNDKNVFGGKARNATVGVNWYVNDHIRFAFNYIRANLVPTNFFRAGTPPHFGPLKRRLDIFALRAQVTF